MNKQDFTSAGFSVLGTEPNENKLLCFLKEHYPSVIKDNEIDLQALKTIAGLPIDEKVNGYGLNFVGRNFARAKYAQKTDKELLLNTTLSKHIDTTQNLVLKGDNLDSLKILKHHYSGKIKCIYIDPPYNTTSDEFVYPDKFDKEETEVLGLANLSEEDFDRMDFSFTTKKSHNGWLAFMYPRLLLARDLLSKDGVIFISIDDNEQANLKLLCDEVFGEENFVAQIIWRKRAGGGSDSKYFSVEHEYILIFAKNKNFATVFKFESEEKNYPFEDENGRYTKKPLNNKGLQDSKGLHYDIVCPNGEILIGSENQWVYAQKSFLEMKDKNRIIFERNGNGKWSVKYKLYLHESRGKIPTSILYQVAYNKDGNQDISGLNLFFDYPKPNKLIKLLINFVCQNSTDIILDFFAGSGTTGHAVMQLNAEDGGNRKFILCQIDEPIKKDKPAYSFCIENNLPPVISSITIERLKRAGERLNQDFSKKKQDAQDLFNPNNLENLDKIKVQTLDIGFKVFDSAEAPKLEVDEHGQIAFPKLNGDALSRIYNMIFRVGLDEPTQVPEVVKEGCIYRIGNNYYLTNCEEISREDYSNAIKNGKVFIDGWTASLNGTLLNYKEDVKIVF
ncbi:hypothetical protein CHS0354_023989 [Potamilus streckersoni]|uniref:DNA methylase N-4/N-6 domain-containing protein n=1 Tax=Potamilus streckersoni TaxID=2493646 RepID=A0AAE0RZL9_9BIVA|nr:hypothetical protein CHS0354_023989 [Potamilus streckersoni]